MKAYPVTVQNWSASPIAVDFAIGGTAVTLSAAPYTPQEVHAAEWWNGTAWVPIEGPSVLLVTVAGRELHQRPDNEASAAAVHLWGVVLATLCVLCAVFR